MFKFIKKWYFKLYHLFRFLGIFILIFGIQKNVYAEELPENYIEIPYLENTTGEEYIDTEIQLNVEGQIEQDSIITTNGAIFGDRTTTGRRWSLNLSGSKYVADILSRQFISGIQEINIRETLKLNKTGLYKNNTQIGTIGATGTANSSNIYLFKINSSTITGAIQKIYNVKIRNNYSNKDLADFVPVYEKNQKKYGMYDTIREKFFENLGGGSFKTSDEWTPPEENPPIVEDEVYSNFLTLYTNKLNYLANGFTSNKYLLAMIGIIFGWVVLELFLKILHLRGGYHK